MKPTESKLGYFQRFQAFAMNRMAPSSVIEKDSLTYWRVRILFAIIFTGLLLALFAFVPVITLLIKENLWGLLIFNGFAWVIGLSLLLSRRLRYEIRAAIALLIVYAIGLVVIIFVGPLSGGPAWLFGFAVLVGVLLGSKAAIMALTVNAISLTIIGWLISAGLFGQTFPFFNTTEAMIVAGANFMLLNTIAAISVAVLVKGLVSIHHKERDLTSTLERERSHLIDAKKELELEVEERKQAEETLRESEERYRELINSITDFIYSHDLEGRFITVNRAAAETLGYIPKDLIGRPISDFMLPKYRQAFKEEYLQQIKEKGSIDGVTIYLAKDRSKHYIEYRNVLVRQEGMEPFISGSGRDITEKVFSERKVQRLQEQLQRSQKMEALGLMAGGIAHDLNNILSGIVSYPDLLLMDLPEDSPLRKPIEIIQNSGQRAAAVVSDLLTVARGVATGKEVLNLNTVIEEYLQSPEHKKLATMRPSITFKTQLDSDLLNISCSSSHIKKSLMNLITNASEAIEDRGNVIVSTINMYLDEPIKGYEDIRRGEYAVMTVSDDGPGISPEDLERIFEPFYTKKVMGRSGTGLGLAVVWNTVQDHEGYINVKTGEDGITFELYFPITRDEVTAEEGQVPIEDYMGHGEKILVVDDEENQRDIACGLLAKLGYTTEAVSSGEETIKYLKNNSADLLVLDMIMDPGIDGLETYKRILELHPGQKAIIASEFSETDRVKEAQRLGAGKYIKKPYTLEKIGLAVKEELDPALSKR